MVVGGELESPYLREGVGGSQREEGWEVARFENRSSLMSKQVLGNLSSGGLGMSGMAMFEEVSASSFSICPKSCGLILLE